MGLPEPAPADRRESRVRAFHQRSLCQDHVAQRACRQNNPSRCKAIIEKKKKARKDLIRTDHEADDVDADENGKSICWRRSGKACGNRHAVFPRGARQPRRMSLTANRKPTGRVQGPTKKPWIPTKRSASAGQTPGEAGQGRFSLESSSEASARVTASHLASAQRQLKARLNHFIERVERRPAIWQYSLQQASDAGSTDIRRPDRPESTLSRAGSRQQAAALR